MTPGGFHERGILEPIVRRRGDVDPRRAELSRSRRTANRAVAQREMARALAVLFMAGGSLSLATLLFPYWSGLNAVGICVPAVTAVLAGLGLWFQGPRLPRGALHVFLVLGTGCISTAVYFGGGSAHAIYSPYFVWVSLYAFYFFTPLAAGAHLGLSSGAFLTTLTVTHSSAAGPVWLVTTGTSAMTGMVVMVLVRRLRALAVTDPLTGLANRRAWEDALSRELGRATRHGTPLTIAMLDLDGLKKINDDLGHAAGDQAITAAADSWQKLMRSGDVLARLGGDEFGLILPACDSDDGHELLERIRGGAGGPRVSCGLACLEPGDTPEDLTTRADLALNEAKRRGRDQVVRSVTHRAC